MEYGSGYADQEGTRTETPGGIKHVPYGRPRRCWNAFVERVREYDWLKFFQFFIELLCALIAQNQTALHTQDQKWAFMVGCIVGFCLFAYHRLVVGAIFYVRLRWAMILHIVGSVAAFITVWVFFGLIVACNRNDPGCDFVARAEFYVGNEETMSPTVSPSL